MGKKKKRKRNGIDSIPSFTWPTSIKIISFNFQIISFLIFGKYAYQINKSKNSHLKHK